MMRGVLPEATVQLGLNPTIATLNSEESRRFLIAS